MKICIKIVFLVCVFATQVFAQQGSIRNDIGSLLQAGKIDEARTRVDEYLKTNPNDVDALMMKGNVLLNGYISNQIGVIVSANTNESIFDTSIGFIHSGEGTYNIEKKYANDVASYWKRCLAIDPKRKDIHQGLCYLYMSALMTDELAGQFALMKKTFPKDDLVYVMGDYARMLSERGYLDLSVKAYTSIMKLYPENGGIVSDLAARYFTLGSFSDAVKTIDQAVTRRQVDQLTYENYFMIHFLAGDYEKAINMEVKSDKTRAMYYNGLFLYYNDNHEWKKYISDYLERINKDKNSAGIYISRYLLSNENTETYDSYLKATSKNDYMSKILLYRKMIKKFPEKADAYLSLGIIMTYYRNFNESVSLFKTVKDGKYDISDKQKSDVNLYSAFSLQELGKFDEANSIWIILLDDSDFYRKSAACYFYGKNLIAKGEKDKAIEIMKKVSDNASRSKYATYCWNIVKREKTLGQ